MKLGSSTGEATAAPLSAVDAPAHATPAIAGLPVPLSQDGAVLRAAERLTCARDSRRRRLLAAADVVGLLIAFAVAWTVFPAEIHLAESLVVFAALPLWVVLSKTFRLYDRDAVLVHKSTLNELPAIAQTIAVGASLLFFAAPLAPGVAMDRGEIAVFVVTALVTIPVLRWSARAYTRLSTPPERCLIVGSDATASAVARKLRAHPEYGIEVVGFADMGAGGDVVLDGDLARFEAACRDLEVERIVVAFADLPDERLLDVIRVGKRLGLKVSIVPRFHEVFTGSVELDQVEGMALLGLRGVQRTKSTLQLKRAIDIAFATVALVAMAPLMGIVAASIKLTSRGPVFFAQERVGRGNRVFRMWKFRTMVDGADALKPSLAHLNEMRGGPMFKISDDPRVTRVGRLLRRSSLDELPQLWNVLRGEMSIVGPRPLVPSEDGHVIGWHRARLDLTPGLTGPWQVLGRNAIPFDEMVKLDYLYVAEWTLWQDVKLMVRTLPVLLARRGA